MNLQYESHLLVASNNDNILLGSGSQIEMAARVSSPLLRSTRQHWQTINNQSHALQYIASPVSLYHATYHSQTIRYWRFHDSFVQKDISKLYSICPTLELCCFELRWILPLLSIDPSSSLPAHDPTHNMIPWCWHNQWWGEEWWWRGTGSGDASDSSSFITQSSAFSEQTVQIMSRSILLFSIMMTDQSTKYIMLSDSWFQHLISIIIV